MPHKDPKKRAAAKKKHRETLKDDYKAREHLTHQKNLEKRRKQMAERNLAAGHQPRTKGDRAKPEIKVPKVRKWQWLNNRVYFSTMRGFEIEELQEITLFIQGELKKFKTAKRKS